MPHSIRVSRSTAAAVGMLVVLLIGLSGCAATNTVKPQGEFAQIDTRLAIETMQILSQGSVEEKLAAIERIRTNPENYAPPVYYLLSNVFFANGEKEGGAFWFYAGQLRARIDANICTDASARQAVSVLNNNYGGPINEYAFQDIPKLEALIPKVVEWERTTPYNYDRRWINLHGMDAMMSGLDAQSSHSAPLSYPEDQWNEIAEKTRADYLTGFKQAMAQMKDKD